MTRPSRYASKLAVISARAPLKIPGKIGYSIDHQTGRRMIPRNRNHPHRRITVPNHKEMARGALRAIMGQSGPTLDGFRGYLK